MCNPRQITVRATRQLDEAWRDEIERRTRLGAVVVGDARIVQPFGRSLADSTRERFEAQLEADEAWAETDAGFRHDVDGGYVVYRRATSELEIVAEVSEEIEVEGRASTEVGGVVSGELETEGTGMYYDDGWGGRTEERAAEEAQERAESGLADLARERIREARLVAERLHGSALEAEAEATARERLAARSEERRSDLANEARSRLRRIAADCRAAVNRALAASYRDAILEYARANGAEPEIVERDGVVNIQFEYEG